MNICGNLPVIDHKSSYTEVAAVLERCVGFWTRTSRRRPNHSFVSHIRKQFIQCIVAQSRAWVRISSKPGGGGAYARGRGCLVKQSIHHGWGGSIDAVTLALWSRVTRSHLWPLSLFLSPTELLSPSNHSNTFIVETCTGWPRHRENRENRKFGSYFFQTGKTQGILFWHREKFANIGKIFGLWLLT